MNLLHIYSKDYPKFIEELINTPEFKRLDNIGMNCGCEYTSFPILNRGKEYTRYIHSIGVAIIVWHFTKDIKQSVAGLLHDISSPVFAHVVDFLNGDHDTQESTEENTEEIIENSIEIQKILKKYNLTTKDVCDYHIYPVADNDSPLLSADRLEYTLGNAYYYSFKSIDEIKSMYDDLVVCKNEANIDEISFTNLDKAVEFTSVSLVNSRVYTSHEDRFAMQYLADLLKEAIDNKALSLEDLYKTESEVINKLCMDDNLKLKFKEFTKFSKVVLNKEKPNEVYSINVSAKKRYINPQLTSKERVSSLSSELSKDIDKYLKEDFNIWVSGTY
ncbi:HD domain-containing protein [Romboutsia sp.]|uniref:HD domain-containing protein n=1 Tax=Romboutsia sp. TaxID=1965302 RepID=UPI003F3531C7